MPHFPVKNIALYHSSARPNKNYDVAEMHLARVFNSFNTLLCNSNI